MPNIIQKLDIAFDRWNSIDGESFSSKDAMSFASVRQSIIEVRDELIETHWSKDNVEHRKIIVLYRNCDDELCCTEYYRDHNRPPKMQLLDDFVSNKYKDADIIAIRYAENIPFRKTNKYSIFS